MLQEKSLVHKKDPLILTAEDPFVPLQAGFTVEKGEYGGLQRTAIQNKQKCTSKNLFHTDAT